MRMRSASIAAVGFFSLFAGLLFFCQKFATQADQRVLVTHQARMECLIQKSSSIPGCRQELGHRPEDVDYCPDAVAACRNEGFYQSAQQADEISETWEARKRAVRFIAILASLATMLGICMVFRKRFG